MPQRILLFLLLVFCSAVYGQWTGLGLNSSLVQETPSIDGIGDDAVWNHTTAVTVLDGVWNRIRIRSVHTREKIFLLVEFSDRDINRSHKTLLWNSDQNRYIVSEEREDELVLQWLVGGRMSGMLLSSDEPSMSDIWHWMAYRTDHAGYAEDKIQIYSDMVLPGARQWLSDSGKLFYLRRVADEGWGAYRTRAYDGYKGDRLSLFDLNYPIGSRADVRAKGSWQDGVWTVEFSRRLNTRHRDDIQFRRGKRYMLRLSAYDPAEKNIQVGSARTNNYSNDGSVPITLILEE